MSQSVDTNIQEENANKFICNHCGRILTSKSNLVAHQKNTKKCLKLQGKLEISDKNESTTSSNSKILLNRLEYLETELSLMKSCLETNNKMLSYLSGLLPPTSKTE